jgi:hypothetical protein
MIEKEMERLTMEEKDDNQRLAIQNSPYRT